MTGIELQVAMDACPECRPKVPCPGHALDLEALERAQDAGAFGRMDEEAWR